jgi:HAD superfamily hydrolase (TIGR01549 family)
MNTIKTVIFDLDGTIGDTVPLCIKAFRYSIEPLLKRSISDEEIMATFGPSEEGTMMFLAPEFYEKGMADYLHFYEKYHDMCPEPFNGIESVLKMLKEKGVHLAIVTGKGKHSTAISLKKFRLGDYFDLIETGIISGPSKHQGIQRVLEHYPDLDKDHFVYVGDAPSDIMACRKVGIPIVSVAWASLSDPERLKALEPDELFYTMTDFSDWLRLNIQ